MSKSKRSQDPETPPSDDASPDEVTDYHELQKHTRKVLEAARAELAKLDRQRTALKDRIHHMELMLGLRRLPTAKRRGRIPSSTLKADVVDILEAAPDKKLSASKILDQLIGERAYPGTRSLRTRVYGALSGWAADGEFLRRVERGVYQLL